MEKVRSSQIVMRPRWYFVAGSISTFVGVVCLSVVAIFLTNLTFFLLRRHGPMAQWRLQEMLASFPLWIPVLAALGIGVGIWLLRRYDFSYKQNFHLIIAGFLVAILMGGFFMDRLGLNDMWARRGQMRRFYETLEGPNRVNPEYNQGWRRGEGRGRNQGLFLQ